jgi:hypothetical protein
MVPDYGPRPEQYVPGWIENIGDGTPWTNRRKRLFRQQQLSMASAMNCIRMERFTEVSARRAKENLDRSSMF